MTSFHEFALSPPILDALAREDYATPTPIQSQAIPKILVGSDVLGIAQTGTGKTAAFAVPILQRLAAASEGTPRGSCRALVLSPTRELASQIAQNFRAYGSNLRLSTAVVFGGVPLGPQQRQLARGVDILVATPGRLLDLIDRRSLTLSGVRILVLDEADRMLDLGFVHALRRIVKLLPRQRQTLLFSATMPPTIARLAEEYLNDPVKVVVTPAATTVERVEQRVIFVPSDRKRHLLTRLLRGPGFARVLVFTRTKHGADRVVRQLTDAGIDAAAIHGNKSQPQRERALAGFRAGNTPVLVATDIAARGIDVEGVTHVINFELPNVAEDYVHRIGRTARAGAAGVAIALCSPEERTYLCDIERLTRLPLRVIAGPDRPAAAAGGAGPQPAQPPMPQPRRAPSQHPHPNGRRAAPRVAGSGSERWHQAGDSVPAFLRGHPATRSAPSGRRDARPTYRQRQNP